MANELDEMNFAPQTEGHDINVIPKQIPIKVGKESKAFEIMLWCLALIPGIVFWFMKKFAGNYLRKLEQRINVNASEIDNYQEQRVMILKNAAELVKKAVDFDIETMTKIAAYRSGNVTGDNERNELAASIDNTVRSINVAVERYPDLKAHREIAEAMRQNDYLQREITAARTVYNDSVHQWNAAVNSWPTKMIVAAKNGYTTRIPFITSQEIKAQSRDVFF